MRSDRIVATARSWIGTPYQHQASKKGIGADCLGLLRGVWGDLYGREPETPPPYTPDWAEPQREERLWAAARRHLHPVPLDAAGAGNVALFRMREDAVAKHLGILAADAASLTVIHAYSGHGVVESPLSGAWRRRIVAAFAFPGKEI